MFGLLTRAQRKAGERAWRTFRPVLERLETRDCPAAGPAILSLSATVLANQTVQLSGVVSDPNPAPVQINFSGVLSGSTTASSNGAFSYQATGTSLGTVSATATDGQNQASGTVQVQVSTPAPTITGLSITYGAKKIVTVSGTVTDVDSGGLAVTFSGVVVGSATTAANGSFTLMATATGLGNITMSVTDLWSQTGTAQVAVAPDAPTISNFTGIQALSLWTFTGTVTAPSLQGMQVTLGGLPELNNAPVTINADGLFIAVVQLAAGESGTASAQATDCWGQLSNKALFAL
jgi:hypothetical protein